MDGKSLAFIQKPAPAKKAKAPKLCLTETDHNQFRSRDIHHGKATIAYGPSVKHHRRGWHAPGGNFTASMEVACVWAEQLDGVIQQLNNKTA